MKVRLFSIFLIFMVCVSLPASALESESLIRLHILANSDSDDDQAVKLLVRDEIRAQVKALVDSAECSEDAYEALNAGNDALLKTANDTLANNGFGYGARIEIGFFDFPEREYGETLVPAGNYRALRIVLGAGEGQNWWCVLYPDLCFVDEACRESAAKGEYISFYSSIGKWFASWRSRT